MINPVQKQILIVALFAGELMLKSGAEVYRVEDTISRICKACGIHYAEAFVTTTGIFISIDMKGDNKNDMHTFIKRIHGGTTDLDKISRLNQFSRQMASSGMSANEAMEELKEIGKRGPYPLLLRLFAAGLVAGFFCLIFGGKPIDFPAAFLTGTAAYYVGELLEKIAVNYFIRSFCCSAFSALVTQLICHASVGNTGGAIIIGCLMIFVPGVAITNAIRDLLTGDVLAGISRLTEASVIAIALAAGAGIVLKLFAVIGGGSL
ncbi:MAG: threonine/serine exporter family protein [Clostridia bacterium]|nr:threonine/serine exporter family protein [Clostridia bacterium]